VTTLPIANQRVVDRGDLEGAGRVGHVGGPGRGDGGHREGRADGNGRPGDCPQSRSPGGHRGHAGLKEIGKDRGGGASSAKQKRGLTAGYPPQPAARLLLGPVGPGALPHGEEGLLQHVLDVGRRQRGAQPGGQHRRVPCKQLAQCGVVTACQAPDQLVVVHHLFYSTRQQKGSRIP
jgi:hypothetical protein